MVIHSINDSNCFWILRAISYVFLKSLLQSAYYTDLITRYNLLGFKFPEVFIDVDSAPIDWINSNPLLSTGINSISLTYENNKYHLDFLVDLYFCIYSIVDITYYLDELDEKFYSLLDLFDMEEDDFSFSVHLTSNKYSSTYTKNHKLNCEMLLLCQDIDYEFLSDFNGIYFTESALWSDEFCRLYHLGIIPKYEVADFMRVYYELIDDRHKRDVYNLRVLCDDLDDLNSFALLMYKEKLDIELEIELLQYEVIDNNSSLDLYLSNISRIFEKYKLKFRYTFSLEYFTMTESNKNRIKKLRSLGLLLI